MSRRFPPPWTIEEYNDACFIVRPRCDHEVTEVNKFRTSRVPMTGTISASAANQRAEAAAVKSARQYPTR
jgi:quinolinate synthase